MPYLLSHQIFQLPHQYPDYKAYLHLDQLDQGSVVRSQSFGFLKYGRQARVAGYSPQSFTISKLLNQGIGRNRANLNNLSAFFPPFPQKIHPFIELLCHSLGDDNRFTEVF
jgi:hypothetical protein